MGGLLLRTSLSGRVVLTKKSENKKFTPKGEGGSGRQASATENTQHFGRLNIETDIYVYHDL